MHINFVCELTVAVDVEAEFAALGAIEGDVLVHHRSHIFQCQPTDLSSLNKHATRFNVIYVTSKKVKRWKDHYLKALKQ